MAKIIGMSVAILASSLLAGLAPSVAQTPRSNITMQGPAEQATANVPRDPLGRPCLDVEAAARAKVINRDMLDHVVSIKNNCARVIKAKVCYVGSDRCNELSVQAYNRVDTILGTVRGSSIFKYKIFQQ